MYIVGVFIGVYGFKVLCMMYYLIVDLDIVFVVYVLCNLCNIECFVIIVVFDDIDYFGGKLFIIY